MYINDIYKGITPISLTLEKDQYTIKLVKQDYQTFLQQIDLTSSMSFNIKLKKVSSANPASIEFTKYFFKRTDILIINVIILALLCAVIFYSRIYLKRQKQ